LKMQKPVWRFLREQGPRSVPNPPARTSMLTECCESNPKSSGFDSRVCRLSENLIS
jgi:hypothetical protein